jgi:hypothetical protein
MAVPGGKLLLAAGLVIATVGGKSPTVKVWVAEVAVLAVGVVLSVTVMYI